MKVFIIGTGNVAAALGKAVISSGHELKGIAGRNAGQAKLLSDKLNCKSYLFPNEIPVNIDLYILAIKDDAIPEVVNQLPALKGIVAHTSGTASINVLKRFSSAGVFYPVASITPYRPRNFKKVPICIESSDERTFSRLMAFAGSLSGELYALDSEQRAALHVAAVFANNFANYILGIAENILLSQHLPPSLLKSLVKSTVDNNFSKGAYLSQTGPALRNDHKTIARHLKFLESNKDYKKLYEVITKQIIAVHKSKVKK